LTLILPPPRPYSPAAVGFADLRLRLAVISPFVDRSHGTERAMAELLERLARRYHCEIHLYSHYVADLEVQTPNAVHREHEGAIFWHEVPGIGGPQLIRFAWWLVANASIRRLDALFARRAIDLVLSPGINCLNPDVVIVHALFHQLSLIGSPNRTERAGFFRAFHRRAYYVVLTRLERLVYRRHTVRLAAVSQRTVSLLARYFHREAVLIPNGVDTSQFSIQARTASRNQARHRRGYHDEDFVLLLIGNDWQIKGLPTILAAMATVSTLPLRLLVVGSDSVGPFKEMANRLGVADRCSWETPQRNVIDFYAAADVYVSPSREDSFGLPVAEAMACGLPVITSVLAGVSSQVRDRVDGFVLREPEDAAALAVLIGQLYSDEPLQRRIGEAAALTAQSWTWDHSADALWELLKSAVQEKRLRPDRA
jgi:glycosyltransferase involved in cell wall biosynthesis